MCRGASARGRGKWLPNEERGLLGVQGLLGVCNLLGVRGHSGAHPLLKGPLPGARVLSANPTRNKKM